MKNKRLVSFLLAALMAATCLPVAASASAPAVDLSDVDVVIGEELLDNGTWAGMGAGHATVSYTEVEEEGNKYLRFDNMPANGVYYRFGESGSNVYPAGDYVLTFKARTQSDEQHDIRIRPFDGSQLNFVYSTGNANVVRLTDEWTTFTSVKFTMAKEFSGLHVWGGPSGKFISPVEYDDVVLTKYDGNNPVQSWTYDFDNKAAVVYNNGSNIENAVEEEYSYYSVSKAVTNKDMITYTSDDEIILEPGIYQLTGDVRMHHFYYQSNHSKYEYTDADSGEAAVAYKGVEHPADCEICAPHKSAVVSYAWDAAGKTAILKYAKVYKAASGAAPIYHINYNNNVYAGDITGEYGEMAKDANAATGAGIYHVLYYIKTGVFVSEAANYRGVAVNLNASVYDAENENWGTSEKYPVAFSANTSKWSDSGDFIEGTDYTNLKVTESWSSFKAAIRVEDYTKLDSIELGGTGYGYDIDPIDFRNISLKQVDSFVVDGEEEGSNTEIMDIREADIAATNGTVSVGSGASFEAGNNYLAVSGRLNNNDGIFAKFKNLPTEPAGEEYKVAFDMRISVPVSLNGVSKNGNYRIYRSNASESRTDLLVDLTQFYYDEWSEVSFDYDKVGLANGFHIVGGGGLERNSHSNTIPFEIDNLRIVDKNGNAVAGFEPDTLDRVKMITGGFETKTATYKLKYAYNGFTDAVFTHECDDVYYNAAFDSAEGELVYDFAADTVLKPGTYVIIGALRNGEYNFSNSSVEVAADNYIKFYPDTTSYSGKRAAIDEDNNGFTYDLTANFVDLADDSVSAKVITSGAANSGWGEFKVVLNITEDTGIDSLVLTFNHLLAGSDVDDVKLTVDYKNFVIEYTPDDEANGIPSVGIIMVLLAKKAGGTSKLPAKGMTTAVADGTTELGEAVTAFSVSGFGRPAVAVEVEDNTYMTMIDRINNGDGITIKDAGLNLDASKSYELKFDIRTSVDVTKIANNSDNVTMSRIWNGSTNMNVNPTYGPDEWTTVTVPYDATKMATGYSVVGGIGATYAHPFDIDNVRVVEAGTDTAVASVDFEDVEAALVAESLTVNGLAFEYRYQYKDAANGKDAKIIVEKETPYVTAAISGTAKKPGGVNYAVTETVLQPGTYTLTMTVRNGLFNGSNTDISKSTAVNYIMREPDDNTTKTRQRITANNNYVNLYAEVVTDTTVFTAKASTAKVLCGWTPLEFTFGVTEPVTVKSVNVLASHALVNTELAVTDAVINVKDVVIWATDAEVVDIPADGPETADVEGNLIENGDFDKKPTIVEGNTYDETKANAWFQNDGEQYDTDANGKEMKEQGMIPFNHKITWNDGYITFSGRENNLRQFWYNSGVTVEPGTYKLTLDFKTANAGETTSVRIAVPGLFTPTVQDALTIDNQWKTMTVEFTAAAATPIRINFWGGPGASYTHDFCVDNVVLVKVA